MWHPLVAPSLITLQLSTTAVVVAFTRQQSLFRASFLAPMVFCAYHQISHLERIQNPVIRAFLGAASVFLIILYLDAAILSRWTWLAQGPTSSLGGMRLAHPTENLAIAPRLPPSSFWSRLKFGYGVSLQSRFPDTRWAVKGTPSFLTRDPAFVPGRASFLLRNAVKSLVFILILRATSGLGKPEDNPVLFSSDNIPFFMRLRAVTLTELGTKVGGVLGYWVVQYLVVSVLYSVFSFVAVALHISTIEKWPPVFGSVSDAWSIRQFWGCFYHQLIRQGCSSIAHYTTYSCLRLRKGSLVTRYVFITLVFTVSGIFHLLCDVSQGIPLSESGAMRFFCIQAFGIMIEDAFHAISRNTISIDNSRWFWAVKRVFGYAWLVSWLVWTSPIWIYPTMQRDVGTPIIPF